MPAPSPKGQGSNPDRRKRRSPPFSPPYARNVFSVPAPESIESAHSAPFSRFHPTGQTASGQTCASALFLLFPRQNQSVHRFLCFRAQMCSFCAARGRFYEYPAPKKSSRFQSVQPPPARFRSLQSYDARKKRDPEWILHPPRSRRHSHTEAARSWQQSGSYGRCPFRPSRWRRTG